MIDQALVRFGLGLRLRLELLLFLFNFLKKLFSSQRVEVFVDAVSRKELEVGLEGLFPGRRQPRQRPRGRLAAAPLAAPALAAASVALALLLLCVESGLPGFYRHSLAK